MKQTKRIKQIMSGQQTKVTTPLSIRRGVGGEAFIFGLFLLLFASCSSDTDEYNPYHDWQARCAAWYEQVADSARRNADGNWLMLKDYSKSPTYQSGITADSICVHVLSRGSGKVTPHYTDSVRIDFRGWLMPTVNARGEREEVTFTQTYYGDFDPATAAPQLASVKAFTSGFATALQYMVEGDDWMVYVPQELFYGSSASGIIPAYSAARFRLHLVAIYPPNTYVPDWH
jgi:FKBP-type peptidyl-prolyl cis-trans isomerase FklB